jgi:ABC-type amino acid transport substrate-binding protein
VRPGTISAALVEELNQDPGAPKIQAIAMPQVNQAIVLLQQGAADAVLADELQLSYALAHHSELQRAPILVLRGLRPESQGFAYAPQLAGSTTMRIDLAISRLKRSGEVMLLREEALRAPNQPAVQ